MRYNISKFNNKYNFEITASSYIGNPIDGTVLFVTKKVKSLLSNLRGHKHCMVFIEEGIDVPEEYSLNNCFYVSNNPQLDYGIFALELEKADLEQRKQYKYTLNDNGSYIGENVQFGKNVIIEPNCLIDHNVIIGDDAYIGFGSTIRNAIIGNNFRCYDHACIGADSFFMAETDERKFRIPSFGKVYIGNNVDLGCNVVIERGFNSDTKINDNVKIDANVCIGHDCNIEKETIVACGSNIAGFVDVGEKTYIGMNATVKQRLSIGNNAMVGMGASVITKVKDDISVFGNPARKCSV